MDNDEIVREAMRILRSRRDPDNVRRAVQAATDARRGSTLSAEHKAKLRAAQGARRERERAEREAASPSAPAMPVRPRGRPKKQIV